MTTKRVRRQQHDIHGQNNGPDTNAERFIARSICKPHRLPHIPRQQCNKAERQIQKIPVDILHDEWQRILAEVRFARLTYGAARRIGPEGFVIRAAVVITRKSKSTGRPENEERG